MRKIVDTNVPMFADGRLSDQASPGCQKACYEIVTGLIERGEFELVVDLNYLVLKEYTRQLTPLAGGLGKAFLDWVLANQATGKVVLVWINAVGDSFTEFPADPALAAFDRADHKWVATSVAHRNEHEYTVPIVQAADTKWTSFETALHAHGIEIEWPGGCRSSSA